MHFVAALLYGSASSVLIAIVLGFFHGGLGRDAAAGALSAGGLIAFVGWLHGRKQTAGMTAPRGWEWFPIILFGLFTLRAFLWLIFRDGDDLCVLSPNNLGDMSLHLTFIHYLANGAPFWPDSPICADGKLAYSVGSDLFNALLVLVGVDDVRGLIWVGLLGATFSGMALWKWDRGFALMGFLCSGGLLGFAAFTQAPGEPFFQDYPGLLKFDWAWKSLPLSLLVTQRGFLFALPAGLLLLASWRNRVLPTGDAWRLPRWGEWLLYVALPVFHLHTFLALSFVLACWFIARRDARASLLKFVAAAFIPATALVFLTTGMFQANAEPIISDMSQVDDPPKRPTPPVLGWQPGWMVNDPQDRFDLWALVTADNPAAEPWESHGRFLAFWLGNFGILPIFAGIVAWQLLPAVTGRRFAPGWGILAALVFIAVTPLLGQWPSYQEGSLSRWLLGSAENHVVANAVLATVGLLAVVGWAHCHRQKRLHPTLRWVLFAISGILFLDGVLGTTNHYFPAIPLLRANALPLLVATGGFVALLLAIARRPEHSAIPVFLLFPGLFLFFVCCNVKFAPSSWDNTKLMLWAYLLVLPPLWEGLLAKWRLLPRGTALVVLFFSGFVSLLGGLNGQYHGYPIARLSELDAVRHATADISITATFASEPTYNHPLLLIGRKVVLGYRPHLWSHGILHQRQERLLNRLMEGEADWRLSAAWLGARYLFFGPREAAHWEQSLRPWMEGSARIYDSEFGSLYDLETPALPIEP